MDIYLSIAGQSRPRESKRTCWPSATMRLPHVFMPLAWIAGGKSMQYFARGRAQIPGTVEGNLRGVYIGDRKGRDVAVAVDPRGAPALRFAARPVPDRQAHPSVCPFLQAGKSAVTDWSILVIRIVSIDYLMSFIGAPSGFVVKLVCEPALDSPFHAGARLRRCHGRRPAPG